MKSADPLPPHVGSSLVRERLRRGGTVLDRTRGGSMRPFLPTGTELEVAPLTAPLLPGDIVLVAFGERLVAHRLLRTPTPEGRPALTKGDACRRPDPPVAAERLLGRAIRVRRPSGAWIDLRLGRWRVLSLLWTLVTPWVGFAFSLRSNGRCGGSRTRRSRDSSSPPR